MARTLMQLLNAPNTVTSLLSHTDRIRVRFRPPLIIITNIIDLLLKFMRLSSKAVRLRIAQQLQKPNKLNE